MSSRSAALPIERDYLRRAWLVVAGIVVVAIVAMALAFATAGAEPAGGTGPGGGVDFGPPTVTHEPIAVNGVVCGQCR